MRSIAYTAVPVMTRLGILISGRGSNMQAIVRACDAGLVPAEVALIVSNRADAAGLDWARDHGLATAVLSHRNFGSREEHDRATVEALRSADVEWVCLAGYMRLLSHVLVDAFPHRILNIHPSLLPAFPGLNAQRQALEYGVAVSGCTVHLVDLQLDHGPIVAQRVVEVLPTDSVADLEARILSQEHALYPLALAALLEHPWRLLGRRLIFERDLGDKDTRNHSR